ncbi:hypothetical protein BC332_04320 [Capsicum chinense]|nr:hypothetical protein BC332_04320 [Capsicum chinense]
MVEAAVSYVTELLIDLFQRKIVFLRNVQQGVEGVRNELIRMKCFLKDADMKQEEDEAATIRNWISEIRAVAYHAEDVIKIFIHQVESQQRQGFFIKCVFYPKKLYCLYKVGKELKLIQTRILEISNSRERYGIRPIQGLGDGEGSSTTREKMRELRRSSPLVANKDVVGLEKHVSAVMSILLKEDKRLHVASIVGMGGVGKTTLAKEVYNQTQIRDKFEGRSWLYVSQDYKPMKTIFKELILQLADPEEDNVKILKTMDKLSQAEAWDRIVRSFPNNGKSSRFLLTSRRREVALHADAHTTPYKLEVLNEEESWELFLKKALPEDRECPQDLVDVGKKILEKCDGLPLAITVMGGLLAGKKKQRSLRQKGKDISVKQLMHIWTAHGLIHQKEEQKLEDIVEDYLDELIGRNMLQIILGNYVPNVLWKLENLWHLFGYINSPSLLKIDRLNNLQTLGSIPVHHWMHNENLTRMTNLQKVGLLIENDDNLDMDRLCDSLAAFESLQSLCLEVEDGLQISLVGGLSKLSHVVKLKLKGDLASIPAHPCVFPPNLSQLTLVNSKLYPDSIQVLEKLTNLSVLKLVNAFHRYHEQADSMTISENGFRGLKLLRLDQLMSMKEMKPREGAMAGLNACRSSNATR